MDIARMTKPNSTVLHKFLFANVFIMSPFKQNVLFKKMVICKMKRVAFNHLLYVLSKKLKPLHTSCTSFHICLNVLKLCMHAGCISLLIHSFIIVKDSQGPSRLCRSLVELCRLPFLLRIFSIRVINSPSQTHFIVHMKRSGVLTAYLLFPAW